MMWLDLEDILDHHLPVKNDKFYIAGGNRLVATLWSVAKKILPKHCVEKTHVFGPDIKVCDYVMRYHLTNMFIFRNSTIMSRKNYCLSNSVATLAR